MTEENKNAAEVMQEKILEALETVITQSLNDIVNLGPFIVLIWMKEGHCRGYDIYQTMGCPLADIITDEIHRMLAEIEEVKTNDEIGLVSAWSPDRMSRYARIALGMIERQDPHGCGDSLCNKINSVR